jgi:ribonuclease HII
MKLWEEASLKKPADSHHLLHYTEEKACEAEGYQLVAGVDEVGRGCLAGPVVASAVIMSRQICPAWYPEVRDSKLLSPRQREHLSPIIHQTAISIGTGAVNSYLIDSLGMTAAVRLAMCLALRQLAPRPDYILIDYLTIPGLACPQKGITDGDNLVFSIACASIVAKVYRDHLMQKLDRQYPGYGLAQHKGYCTTEHLEGLRRLGPSPIHRRLFHPVREFAQLSFDQFLKSQMEPACET